MTEDKDPNEIEIEPASNQDPVTVPDGAPADFWTRLALALKTTNADVLEGAAANFCGVHESAHHYICAAIGYDLPLHLDWLGLFLLDQVDALAFLKAYEQGKVAIWTVGNDAGTVMVFESFREGVRGFTVPWAGGERVQVYLDRKEPAAND